MVKTRLNEIDACGPGCACGTPSSGGKTTQLVVSLLALAAVAGILIYKAVVAKDNSSDIAATKDGVTLAFAQPALGTMSKVAGETQPSAAAKPDAAKVGQRVGEYLDSLSALNEVATNQDAVFIFIPNPQNDLADDKTSTAVHAAQQALKRRNIALGLYTLRASSPDYSGISAQVQAPAILVACKGRGIAAVSGDVTEQKLLQAFMASLSGGGCGPSGCGSSGSSCN